MLALGIETESEETRKDMMKRLDGEKIRKALVNMRAAGIKSFGFFILGYPGDTRESLERTIDYAIELDPDFANFYPAVPYPGTDAVRQGQARRAAGHRGLVAHGVFVLPAARQRTRRGPMVLDAINRAQAAVLPAARLPGAAHGRHFPPAATKWNLAWHVGSRVLFGAPVTHAQEDASADTASKDASLHATRP